MRWLLLLCLLLLPITVYSQARTASAYQSAPFSQLTSGVPNGQVRWCINCQANASTGTCESGASQMVATKLNGIWKCSSGVSGGAGTGTVTGSGTVNTVPKFTTSTAIGNAAITDNGTTINLGRNTTITGALSTSAGIGSAASITAGVGFFFGFTGRSLIQSPADGQLIFSNNATSSFSRLYFGTTSLPYLEVVTGTGTFLFNDTSGGGTATVTAGQFVSGPSSTASGGTGFKSADADGSVTIVAPNNAGTPYTPWTFTLPTTGGTNGMFMKTNGSGTMSFSKVDLASSLNVTGNLPIGNLNSGTSASGSTFWRGDGTWATPAGAGTVTNTGTLTSLKLIKGNGSSDVTASTVTITDPATAGSFIFGTDNADLTFQGDGVVVNRDSTDTLTNKSISGSTNTLTNIPLATAVTGNLPVANLNGGSGASATTFWRGDATWASGVGDVSSNTVTSVDSEFALFSGTGGKTIKRATGTGVAISIAGVFGVKTNPSGAFVGDTDAQTLTNKTFTLPTIGSFANANHNHTGASSGGLLTIAAFSSSSGTGAVLGQTAPTISAPTIADLSNVQHNHNSTASGGSLTSPKVITGINDTNGNELIKVTATASAVNEITVANAATGSGPTISVTGGDTDGDLNLAPKGAGSVKMGSAGVASLITLFNAASDAATLSTDTVDIVKAGKAVQWTTGSKPACAAGIRGTVWYVAGGAGVADTFEVCRKDAADAYAWVALF